MTAIGHVAFVMDGNRRWAKQNKFELLRGHSKGADVIQPLVEYAAGRDIQHLTFWAFSTENWKRDSAEVEYLMDLFREFITGRHVAELMEKGVRLTTIGDISKFPGDIPEQVEKVVEESSKNTRIHVTMALNYGGRAEIIRAVNSVIKSGEGEVDERIFEKYLYTAGTPDPDIIVRTGGERRLSGYMPWQGVYSELFFTDTLWPDFTPAEFEQIIKEYELRERRFGK